MIARRHRDEARDRLSGAWGAISAGEIKPIVRGERARQDDSQEFSMHLVYFDESGNTGNNLDDPQQPILVVGALIVAETCWQSLETDLESALIQHIPSLASPAAEIHGSDLRNGTGPMRGVPVAERIALRDAWLKTAHRHGLKFVYRSIEKKRYKVWQLRRRRDLPDRPARSQR